MLKTEKLAKLVKYVLLSGYIARNTAPLSLMLVAPPESNKTSILKLFENVKGIKYTTDLSGKPLTQFLKETDNARNTTFHLIVPDFIKVIAHGSTTVQSVVTTLNAMIEEGIQHSMFYGQELSLRHNVKIGMITSMTPDLYKQQFKTWNDIGFLSRFLTVSYNYSPDTINEISKFIAYDAKSDDGEFQRVRARGQHKIAIEKDVIEGIRLFTADLAKRLSTYKVRVTKGASHYDLHYNCMGLRLLKQTLLLSKCIALDKGYATVNYECLAELKSILEYVNMPDNPKVV